MIFPTGALRHHLFEVLSHGLTQNVRIEYNSTPYVLPEAVAELSLELEKKWTERNPGIRNLQSVVSVRSIRLRDTEIFIRCRPASYFDHLFTNCSLQDPLLHGFHNELLQHSYETSPTEEIHTLSHLANCLSIAMTVITRDNHVVFAKRKADAKDMTRDKGLWANAVSSLVKRHDDRYLDANGKPCPQISAQMALREELGDRIAALCSPPDCMGLVLRDDVHAPVLLYETLCDLPAEELVQHWDKHVKTIGGSVEQIRTASLKTPDPVLGLLEAEIDWCPQHAACMIHSLARRFEEAKGRIGMSFS